MPFKTFKTLEEIDEAQREDAVELKDGTFAVVEDSGARETIAKIRKERDEFKRSARDAEDRLAERQREVDALKATTGDAEKKTGALLEQWRKDTEAAVAAVSKEKDALASELRQVKLIDKAKETFVRLGGRPEKAEAAIKLNRDRLDLIDGVPVIKDEKGEVTTKSLDDYFGKDFRKEMPEFFAGTQAAGGGANGTQKAGGYASGIDVEAMLKDPSLAFRAAHNVA